METVLYVAACLFLLTVLVVEVGVLVIIGRLLRGMWRSR